MVVPGRDDQSEVGLKDTGSGQHFSTEPKDYNLTVRFSRTLHYIVTTLGRATTGRAAFPPILGYAPQFHVKDLVILYSECPGGVSEVGDSVISAMSTRSGRSAVLECQ